MDGTGFWERALIYFLLAVLPWIFVAVGAWLLWSAHRFMGRAVRTTGRVQSVTRHVGSRNSNDGGRPSVTYKPLFEYTDPAGQVRSAETFLASGSYNFDIGSEHVILVDPQGGTVRMPGFWVYGFGAIFMGVGLLFGVVGIFGLAAM